MEHAFHVNSARNQFAFPLHDSNSKQLIQYIRRDHGVDICVFKDQTHHTATMASLPSYDDPPTAALVYWNETAHTIPEADVLAVRIGLDIPQGIFCHYADAPKRLLRYPVRQLVISKEATPSNMKLLLGPTWEVDAAGMLQIWCNAVFHHEQQ